MSLWSILLWQPPSPPDLGESLLASISNIWARNPTLCSLVRFNRVFTGRVPDTERHRFPYVSILSTGGTPRRRSDKSQNSVVTISMHVWVDGNDLARGERIADEISAAYAEHCWQYAPGSRVLDVVDGGPPSIRQVTTPTVKAWEVIQLLNLTVNRERVAPADCCPDLSSMSEQSFEADYDSSSSLSHSV